MKAYNKLYNYLIKDMKDYPTDLELNFFRLLLKEYSEEKIKQNEHSLSV